MPLLSLPNEIIYFVADFLESEQDVNQLAQANRKFYSLLNPYLYKHNIRVNNSSGLLKALETLSRDRINEFSLQGVQEERDLQEYYHPSAATTSDGLPIPLTQVVRDCDKVIQCFPENGASLEVRNKNGATPLLCSTAEINESQFWLLVRHGADIQATRARDQKTLLHLAALNGCTRILRYLVTKMDVNARDSDGYTPLQLAAQLRHEAAVLLLVENGADINVRDTNDWTPLHWLAMKKLSVLGDSHYPALRALLDLGADAEAKTSGRFEHTVLHSAIMYGGDKKEVIEILLEHGVDIEARDDIGRTPLWLAARHSSWKTIKLLVQKRANINSKTDNGHSVLFAAASSTDYRRTLPYLIENGADLGADIGTGKNIVQHLQDRGEEEVLFPGTWY